MIQEYRVSQMKKCINPESENLQLRCKESSAQFQIISTSSRKDHQLGSKESPAQTHRIFTTALESLQLYLRECPTLFQSISSSDP